MPLKTFKEILGGTFLNCTVLLRLKMARVEEGYKKAADRQFQVNMRKN